ncbi:MAG: RNA-binding domain-containing protein [Candidatus Margulisiibacteriota bacterium]
MKNDKFLEYLLTDKEWQIFECKRALAQPKKMLESIVALANSDGGLVVVGLEDPEKATGKARLCGISEGLDNVSEIQNLVHKEIVPPIKGTKTLELDIINIKGKPDKLFLLFIDPQADIHSIKSGKTFVRRGRHNRALTAQEIIHLKYAKGAITYESEVVKGVSIDDLDRTIINKFKGHVGSSQGDNLELFVNNGLAERSKERCHLNNAAVLLFAKNPSILLKRKCGIKITHYFGKKADFSGEPNFIRRPFSIEGSLIEQIQQTFNYIKNWIESSPPKLEGAGFKSKLKYPLWVIQEAIANAVIHRDYSLQNDIQVRIFDNRIEIESPGILPGNITISNIRQDRFARNPIILRTLNRFGDESPNLDIGEGVDRMFDLMKVANLYDPLYLVSPFTNNSVLVVLFNMERISYWDTVSQYLDKFRRITNKELRKITGIKDSVKASRLLKTWVKNKLLEEVKPSKKNTFYRRHGETTLPDLLSPPGENKKTLEA